MRMRSVKTASKENDREKRLRAYWGVLLGLLILVPSLLKVVGGERLLGTDWLLIGLGSAAVAYASGFFFSRKGGER
jgi:hypothetical protein